MFDRVYHRSGFLAFDAILRQYSLRHDESVRAMALMSAQGINTEPKSEKGGGRRKREGKVGKGEEEGEDGWKDQ